MEPFIIDSREQYNLCRAHGLEPLIDRRFTLAVPLRVEIQGELFGRGHTPEENERFYRFCWKVYPHFCQECMKPLSDYSAVYVSHILTRGAHPETAFDPRNVNILCFRCHSKWENGRRDEMRIFLSNKKKIEQLRKEYETQL